MFISYPGRIVYSPRRRSRVAASGPSLMGDLWAAFWLSCGVVFVAELGDKSQLIALTFATRYRPALVLTGIVGATADQRDFRRGRLRAGAGVAHPMDLLIAGLLFIGFAIWTLRDNLEDGDPAPQSGRSHGVVFTVGSAFLLAELGDKRWSRRSCSPPRTAGWVPGWARRPACSPPRRWRSSSAGSSASGFRAGDPLCRCRDVRHLRRLASRRRTLVILRSLLAESATSDLGRSLVSAKPCCHRAAWGRTW